MEAYLGQQCVVENLEGKTLMMIQHAQKIATGCLTGVLIAITLKILLSFFDAVVERWSMCGPSLDVQFPKIVPGCCPVSCSWGGTQLHDLVLCIQMPALKIREIAVFVGNRHLTGSESVCLPTAKQDCYFTVFIHVGPQRFENNSRSTVNSSSILCLFFLGISLVWLLFR